MKWKVDVENFLSGRTESEVFDKSTLMALWKLMDKRVIELIDFPISTGKEGNVFRGKSREGFVAVKIYRINTITFRNISKYLQYDGLVKVKKDRRSVIYAWSKKEFTNLSRLHQAGVRVPKPIANEGNVIVMEYIGDEETPAPLLKDAKMDEPEEVFEDIVKNMSLMYNKANMVHADLSEYNILFHKEPVIIDVGQTIKAKNPMARGFLERDATNIARFFKKFFDVDKDKILKRILEGKT
ncbi:MAG: serine protein kinase RIO [Thermoplasmata archaeon]|nr:serine protein kinase RIO [Thermoplasmata archaeon]RLF45543.1 MAG: serine protein kinase RIO [Thermoplasmata archaeon]